MKLVISAVALLGMFGFGDLLRESNSHAAAKRGAREYAKKDYAAAARAYADAQRLAPSSRAAYNRGTAEVAAGEREVGSARLTEAMEDPALRADALFNRGNSALAAKALDHAVRDYMDALRANPRHAGAKRNLEIALNRRQSQQQGAGGKQDQQGQQQQQQQPKKEQPRPNGQQRQPQGQPDVDSLLRSVQQQEQEELRRMKGRAAEGRVGW